MRRIAKAVFDTGSFFEMGARWGRAVITAFARLDGWPVAVLASEPSYLGGSWDAKTSEKAERFVKLADQFRLPVVHLVDNPGFMIGGEAERTGTIRYGVQAMNAIYRATVPLASVVVRRAYGIAGSAMSNAERFQYRFAWPSGDWGSLPIEGGVEVAYKSELEAAEDPAAHLSLGDFREQGGHFQAFRSHQKIDRRFFFREFRRLRRTRRGIGEAVEEIGGRGLQTARDLVELGCAHPIGAALVLLHLLEGEAERLGKGLLAHPDEPAAHPDAGADVDVHRLGALAKPCRAPAGRLLAHERRASATVAAALLTM